MGNLYTYLIKLCEVLEQIDHIWMVPVCSLCLMIDVIRHFILRNCSSPWVVHSNGEKILHSDPKLKIPSWNSWGKTRHFFAVFMVCKVQEISKAIFFETPFQK